MLNKLLEFIRKYDMVKPGDHIICAVSGGADSVALLFSLYLLREKLDITLSAAHFNHGLRGAESDRDARFVKDLCDQYGIPLHMSCGQVTVGEKGLEAAAREARYAFFATLPGKIATAHTADDNAETVLMHMVRGTGLKGLGGIAPVRDNLIRPMLLVNRGQVMAFLQEYHLRFVQDSSNDSDVFLRNRLRHHLIPLLKQENPKLSESISVMALGLREDEKIVSASANGKSLPPVSDLREMDEPHRRRVLASFLETSGVKEPERKHITAVEKLVFSRKPSAKANFPGGITIGRNYDKLEVCQTPPQLQSEVLSCPGVVTLPAAGVRICCDYTQESCRETDAFTVLTQGQIVVRPRRTGDTMRLPGGTKSLKEIFIDRKIPAKERMGIPVVADECGVLGVCGIGPNLDRLAPDGQGVCIQIAKI